MLFRRLPILGLSKGATCVRSREVAALELANYGLVVEVYGPESS